MEKLNNIKRTQTWNQIKNVISKLNTQPIMDKNDSDSIDLNSITTELESLFQIYLKSHLEKFSNFTHYNYNATDIPPEIIQEYLDENP